MKNVLFLISFLSNSYMINAQCQVTKANLNDGRKLITMTEKVYQNEELSDGSKSFDLTTNNFIDVETRSTIEIVVTYISINHNYWIVPNTLIIELETGEKIISKAREKSSNTLNHRQLSIQDLQRIKGLQTIECYFYLTQSELVLLSSNNVNYIIVKDYKTDESIDITPEYKGQLNEMLNCIK